MRGKKGRFLLSRAAPVPLHSTLRLPNSPHQARHPAPNCAVPPCRLVERDPLERHAVIVVAATSAREPAAGAVCRCSSCSCPPRERRRRVGPHARRGRPGAGGEHEEEGFGEEKGRPESFVAFFLETKRSTIGSEQASFFFLSPPSRNHFLEGRKGKEEENLPMDATGHPDARELAAFSELEGKLVDASRRVKTVRLQRCSDERGRETGKER